MLWSFVFEILKRYFCSVAVFFSFSRLNVNKIRNILFLSTWAHQHLLHLLWAPFAILKLNVQQQQQQLFQLKKIFLYDLSLQKKNLLLIVFLWLWCCDHFFLQNFYLTISDSRFLNYYKTIKIILICVFHPSFDFCL